MTRKRVGAFLLIAEEELAAATRLQAPLPRQAQYFLQQTVEKLIRATLEAADIPAGLLPSGHPLLERFLDFDPLSAASTRYRYPTEAGAMRTISAAEVKDELNRVVVPKGEVLAYLKSKGFP